MKRSDSISIASTKIQDVLIIGSGINGAVSAASLSSRGYQVTLIDKGDFASATSQESSNLIWGGIKYLENYEFKLVRHLCNSRNELLKAFPSQVNEIRFLATHSKKDNFRLNTYWLGCWFYWLMGNGYTQKPKKINIAEINKMESSIITDLSDGAVEYSDSYLPENDSRFVFRFALSANEFGALTINYCEALNSDLKNKIWETKIKDQQNGKEFCIRSHAIINCGGPFVDKINTQNNILTNYHHIFSKGVHLIVPRIQKHNYILTFISDDKRPFFVIPMKNCSSIGTTDTTVPNPTSQVTKEDREFILHNINQRIKLVRPLEEADIIAERCGVRPLAIKKGHSVKGDWISISRKHKIEANADLKTISVFGGKLTDCLNVANKINTIIAKWIPRPIPNNIKWYGEPSATAKQSFIKLAQNRLPTEEAERLWRRYGNYAHLIFSILENNPTYDQIIISTAEYRFYDFILMYEKESIIKLEDILRRRTELALTVRHKELKESIGLQTICKIIFGNNFEKQWHDYFLER